MLTPHSRNTLKLVCFVSLSLLIHALLIVGAALPLPQLVTEPMPLTVRLQPDRPPPAQRTVPANRQRAAARHTLPPAPEFYAAPQPLPEAAAVAESAPPETAAMAPAAPEDAAAETSTAAPEDAAAETSAAPPAIDPAPSEAAPARMAPLAKRLPHKGEITYALYLGAGKLTVGRTRQTWEVQDDNYRLSSVSETTGIAALFANQRLEYESRGRLTADGLQPENFTTHRVRSGRSEDGGADFDWGAMTANIGNPRRSVALSAGTQDIVSFMYQLGLTRLVPGRIELPITNGWKLERYELDIGAEEQLQTPLGPLLALPVKQVRRPGQESIELWLAPAYRLLPVRIRFFDRQGEPSGEQIVNNILVSSD